MAALMLRRFICSLTLRTAPKWDLRCPALPVTPLIVEAASDCALGGKPCLSMTGTGQMVRTTMAIRRHDRQGGSAAADEIAASASRQLVTYDRSAGQPKRVAEPQKAKLGGECTEHRSDLHSGTRTGRLARQVESRRGHPRA